VIGGQCFEFLSVVSHYWHFEILISEKQQQAGMCIVINYTLQRSVAMWFMCGWNFDHYFITNILLSLFWKNF